MAEENEKYLDKLVSRLVRLKSLKGLRNKKRIEAILELPIGPLEDYIQNIIRKKFPLQIIPDGDIYVITPKHGFRYQKTGYKISTPATIMDEFGSEGTSDEAVQHISDLALAASGENNNNNKPVFVPTLFFNKESKIELEKKMKGRGLYFNSCTKDLPVYRYGTVKLYTYHVISPTK